jgi:hypothetical protein
VVFFFCEKNNYIANRRAVYDQYGFEGLKNGVPAREGDFLFSTFFSLV